MNTKFVYCSICGAIFGLTGIWVLKNLFKNHKNTTKTCGKLRGVENWVRINYQDLTLFSTDILKSIGCDGITAKIVGEHLVESNLQSIDSHGVVRCGNIRC